MRVHSLLAAAAVLCTNSGEHIVCREPGRAEPIAEIRPTGRTLPRYETLPNDYVDYVYRSACIRDVPIEIIRAELDRREREGK